MRISVNFLLLLLFFVLTGCSSINKGLKSLIGSGDKKKAAVARTSAVAGQGPVHFSQRPDLRFNSKRKYKRMSKGKFEEQARVTGDSGSLWNMDGQSAYLFSQNQSRKVGDLLNVRIMGAAKEQLQTKVNVIKRLLKKLERERSSRRFLASKNKSKDKKESEKKEGEAKADGNQTASRTQTPKNNVPDDEELKVKTVPTRVVEKLPDGNYRVKGSQAFMIGKREYKVIVTGIVRAEDYNEDGIDSNKIMDPRYDIVSQKRGVQS